MNKKITLSIVGVVIILSLIIISIFAFFEENEKQNDTVVDSLVEVSTPTETVEKNGIFSDEGGNSIEVLEQIPSSGNTKSLQGFLEQYDAQNDTVNYSFTDTDFTIQSTGIPTHETGEFPNAGNPNTISEQDQVHTITFSPSYTGESTPIKFFGISIGGVLFDPGTAERDPETGWSIEAFNSIQDLGLDFNNAHVQPTGTYHYHGIPEGLVAEEKGEAHSSLVGFAADGNPVYARYGYSNPAQSSSDIQEISSSYVLRSGERTDGPVGQYDGSYTNDFEYIEGSGDLDECNGRFTATPEFPNGAYVYFLTEDFPYIPRCVKGEVLESFSSGGGGGQQPGGMPPRR